jgi:hypothetical protein
MKHARLPTLVMAIALAAASSMIAPPALAQGTAPKPAAKPAAKPDPKKAAEEQKKADEVRAAEAAEDQKKADEAKAEEEKKAAAAAATAQAKPAATGAEPPAEEWKSSDVEEIPTKTYLFIGAHYRGTIIPQFMLKLFVDGGATIYSNSFGFDLDKRKDGFSVIPSLSFTEYGTDNILFKEKDSKDIPGNYSYVNSSMKAIYATVDLLWSTKISKNVDFEYGAGFGLGVIFGDLVNNWVEADHPGPVSNDNYRPCATEGMPGTGCNKADHKNTDTAKVGNYTEKSWFDGGSKPVLFPWISLPQVGLRLKPVKQFEARLGLGFALTAGFWFGLSGAYGLEQKPKP